MEFDWEDPIYDDGTDVDCRTVDASCTVTYEQRNEWNGYTMVAKTDCDGSGNTGGGDNTGGNTGTGGNNTGSGNTGGTQQICNKFYLWTNLEFDWEDPIYDDGTDVDCRTVDASCTVTYEQRNEWNGYTMVAKTSGCADNSTNAYKPKEQPVAQPKSNESKPMAKLNEASGEAPSVGTPTTPTGTSDLSGKLYTVECQDTTIKVVDVYEDMFTYKKTYTERDSIALRCRVVFVGNKATINRCDTINLIVPVYKTRDTVIEEEDMFTYAKSYRTITKTDTIKEVTYDIRCYAVDTFYKYDTTYYEFLAEMGDTIATSAKMNYGGLIGSDTILEVCPRLTQTYEAYDTNDVNRLRDSAAHYLALALQLEDQIAKDLKDGKPRPSITAWIPLDVMEDFDTTKPFPDLDPFFNAQISPSAARARAAAFTKQADAYAKAIQAGKQIRTQEHILDTLRIRLSGVTNFGCTIEDTFNVTRMPIPYCHISDTGVLFGKEVRLWARDGYCSNDPAQDHDPFLKRGDAVGTLAVDIKWLDPFYGNYTGHSKTHAYGDPATDLMPARYNYTGKRPDGTYLQDVSNIQPYYLSDTVDGDTMYFPIKIQNADSRDPLSCAVIDTVKVRIYPGYRVSGYVSYNGFWHPIGYNTKYTPVAVDPSNNPIVMAIGNAHEKDTMSGDNKKGENRLDVHMPIPNVKLKLYNLSTNALIDSVYSDEYGLFAFKEPAPPGSYYIMGSSPDKKTVMGANAISANDASWIQQYAIGAEKTPKYKLSMWWEASNTDLGIIPPKTRGVAAADASDVQQVAIGAKKEYRIENTKIVIDDWTYSSDTLDLTADTLVHVRGIMRGDATRNYTGGEKNAQLNKGSQLRRFDTYGTIEVEDKEKIIDYPILSTSEGDVLAFQLFMPYEPSEVELLGITTPIESANLMYNFIGNELLFNWLSMSPVDVHAGDTLATLKLHVRKKLNERLDRNFRIDPVGYEITRGDVTVDRQWQIALPELALYYYEENERDTLGLHIDSVGYSGGGKKAEEKEIMLKNQGGETDKSEIMSVIPNPMKTWADITYSVYGDCVVSLKLYTLLGEEVMSIVNSERQTGLYRRNITPTGLPAGVYVLRLETIHDNTIETDVVKVVVQK